MHGIATEKAYNCKAQSISLRDYAGMYADVRMLLTASIRSKPRPKCP